MKNIDFGIMYCTIFPFLAHLCLCPSRVFFVVVKTVLLSQQFSVCANNMYFVWEAYCKVLFLKNCFGLFFQDNTNMTIHQYMIFWVQKNACISIHSLFFNYVEKFQYQNIFQGAMIYKIAVQKSDTFDLIKNVNLFQNPICSLESLFLESFIILLP